MQIDTILPETDSGPSRGNVLPRLTPDEPALLAPNGANPHTTVCS
jgi:hypothetical protein